MDHIFPKSMFTSTKLKKAGYETEEDKENIFAWMNNIANIQLLRGSDNESKKGTHPEDWLSSLTPEKRAALSLPEMESYALEHFVEFCEKRTEDLKSRLLKKLHFEKIVD